MLTSRSSHPHFRVRHRMAVIIHFRVRHRMAVIIHHHARQRGGLQ